MSFNEGAKHATELPSFVCPDKGVGFVEIADFDSDPDLSPEFSGRTFSNRQKSCNFSVAVSFVPFGDIGWDSETAAC